MTKQEYDRLAEAIAPDIQQIYKSDDECRFRHGQETLVVTRNDGQEESCDAWCEWRNDSLNNLATMPASQLFVRFDDFRDFTPKARERIAQDFSLMENYTPPTLKNDLKTRIKYKEDGLYYPQILYGMFWMDIPKERHPKPDLRHPKDPDAFDMHKGYERFHDERYAEILRLYVNRDREQFKGLFKTPDVEKPKETKPKVIVRRLW